MMSDKNTISQKIAHDIHEKIFRRYFSPGERLPTERDLAMQYGVSRIPVREAIKILAQRGIIETKHGSGNYVKHIDENKIIEQITQYLLFCDSNMNDLGAFWEILESYALGLTATKRTDEEYQTIAELNKACAKEIRKAMEGKPCAFNETDNALHSFIAHICGNKAISNLVSSFHKSLRFKQSLLGKNIHDIGQLIEIHNDMIRGIEVKDPEMAVRALHKDLELGRKLFNKLSTQYEFYEIFEH